MSPDPVDRLQPTVDKHSLTYRLLSDEGLQSASRFGIVFRLTPETIERYKGFGIELHGDTLPVPAVFVIDTEGTVRFSYAHPDYKVRLDPRVLLEAARAAVPQ